MGKIGSWIKGFFNFEQNKRLCMFVLCVWPILILLFLASYQQDRFSTSKYVHIIPKILWWLDKVNE